MTLSIEREDDGRVLRIRVEGHLEQDEYESLLSTVREQINRHGGIRVLVDLGGRCGSEVGTLWEDAKFQLSHLAGVERLALVQEDEWEPWMGDGARPLLSPQVAIFQGKQRRQALVWLEEDASGS